MTAKLFVRKIYEKYYKWRVANFHPKQLVVNNNDISVIVSLTTFPKRLHVVHLAIKSILLQTIKPDKIICWLGCDVTPDMITKEMKALIKYGVEYRFVDDNIKPHKKYLYTMKEFPNATVITIDDDVLYDRKAIQTLIKCSKRHPGAVCARRIHKIRIEQKSNTFMPYSNWDYEYIPRNENENMMYFATGIGGVLYPPHCLHEDVFSIDILKKYCLNADDIWLKIMEMRKGTKVVWAKCFYPHPVIIENSQNSCLNKENVSNGWNDIYWRNLIEIYNISPDSINS